MAIFIDLTDRHFGRLKAIIVSPFKGNGTKPETYWVCQCSCGSVSIVKGGSLVCGSTTSCGCLSQERKTKHNKCFTHEYNCWTGMKNRCRHRVLYTNKGITVCDEWTNSFDAFCKDMGPSPTPKHTIDRIDGDKGYYKLNCRWATMKQQNRNRSNNRIITYNGRTMCMVEWSEFMNIDFDMLNLRLVRGWPVEKALTTPKDLRKQRFKKTEHV